MSCPAGVAAGLETIHILPQAVADKEQWIWLEVFAGKGKLSQLAKLDGIPLNSRRLGSVTTSTTFTPSSRL